MGIIPFALIFCIPINISNILLIKYTHNSLINKCEKQNLLLISKLSMEIVFKVLHIAFTAHYLSKSSIRSLSAAKIIHPNEFS